MLGARGERGAMHLNEEERFYEWAENSPSDLLIQYTRYLPVKDLVKDAVILDLGCGTGFSSNLLLEWGAKKIYGVDSSEDAIAVAKSKYANPKIEFIHGYAEKISDYLDIETLDGICFVECLEHVIEPELVLRKLGENVNSDSWLYITVPNDYWSYKYELTDNPHHLRRFTKKEFLDLTESYLGVPNQTGEAHAFLGIATVPDSRINLLEIESCKAFSVLDKESTLHNSEGVFFYSLWGKSADTRAAVGSVRPMNLYTRLFDVAKYEMSSPDINDVLLRQMANQIQNLTEALSESQNRLRAISFLMKEDGVEKSPESNSKYVISKSILQNNNAYENSLTKLLKSPPKIVIKFYGFLPIAAKDSLRALRRRLIR